MLHHLPAIAAITAPSPVSYLRLTPNRWAPTVVDIVQQDRGAALRVCPVFAASEPEEIARQFNVEFRVCDGAASPYLALGAVMFAGADGVRRKLALPGRGPAAALPHSLGEALRVMEASEVVQTGSGRCSWRPICATSVRSSRIRISSTQRNCVAVTQRSTKGAKLTL